MQSNLRCSRPWAAATTAPLALQALQQAMSEKHGAEPTSQRQAAEAEPTSQRQPMGEQQTAKAGARRQPMHGAKLQIAKAE